MNLNKMLFQFYCYCEWLVKRTYYAVTCWIQEWLLDWHGTTLRPLRIGPPYLYWWIKEKIDDIRGNRRVSTISLSKEEWDKFHLK